MHRLNIPENDVQQIIQLGRHPALTLLRAAAAAFMDSLCRHTGRRALRHVLAMRTERELGGLDERTLRDLGLTRSEIGSISSEIAGAAAATRRRVA